MLRKIDCDLLKGIAIIMIMLHNIFHLMVNNPGENEFFFSLEHIMKFADNVLQHPGDIVKQIFSFFGHYGVQVFVFLSAYGLTMKYKDHPIHYKSFVKERFVKIYPVFVGAVLLYSLSRFLPYIIGIVQPEQGYVYVFKELLLKLSLLSNFFPNSVLSICGPWWFFSFIFQLYFLYPFLVKLKNKYLLLITIFVWIVEILFIRFIPEEISYLRFNAFGHLPEFILGIYFVRAGIKDVKRCYFLLALVLLTLACVNKYFWIFGFMSVPIITIYLFRLININSKSIKQKVFIYAGVNSLYLFAVHGFLRSPFISMGNRSEIWSIIAVVLFLILSFFTAFLLKFSVSKFKQKLCSS